MSSNLQFIGTVLDCGVGAIASYYSGEMVETELNV